MGRQSDHDGSGSGALRRLGAKLRSILTAPGSAPGSPVVLGTWLVAALVLMMIAAAMAAGSATFSRGLCGSCHEMEQKVSAWKVSPHAEIECYSCHGSSFAWYRFPEALVDRAAMLSKFLRVHVSGRHEAVIGAHGPDATAIPDSTCLQCHDPSRTGTSRLGVLIQHSKHAQRNKSCISCHLWTAHQDPAADRNLLMMARCFECHGQTKQPKASAACIVCHPKELPLRPESHRGEDWLSRHGKIAKADRPQCAMCHRESFCNDCHKLDMPHPLGWARGKSNHAVAARRNREICEQCHTGKTNLCTMCHHLGYDETKGPWVSQHFLMVEETGAAFCMRCHEGEFCVRCHAAGSSAGATSTP